MKKWETSVATNEGVSYVEVGGDVAGLRVSLRLFGEALDPERVTEQLGVKPSKKYGPGDRVSSRSAAKRTQGMWMLQSPLPEERPLDEHIVAILGKLSCSLDEWRMATDGFRKVRSRDSRGQSDRHSCSLPEQ
jgi:hypothetical protein